MLTSVTVLLPTATAPVLMSYPYYWNEYTQRTYMVMPHICHLLRFQTATHQMFYIPFPRSLLQESSCTWWSISIPRWLAGTVISILLVRKYLQEGIPALGPPFNFGHQNRWGIIMLSKSMCHDDLIKTWPPNKTWPICYLSAAVRADLALPEFRALSMTL